MVGETITDGQRDATVEGRVAFASEPDRQPFHLDEEAAGAESRFGSRLAGGRHSASVLTRLRSAPFRGARRAASDRPRVSWWRNALAAAMRHPPPMRCSAKAPHR